MANAIKDFFKKKKIDAKFKMAGTGHKLTDSSLTATSSQSNKLNTNKTNINRSEGSAQRAGEAAIDRIQRQQQSTHNKTNTLENILQEERQRIKEEYKMKEKAELETKEGLKEESKQEKKYIEFESKQLFNCPTIGLNESQPVDILMEQINDYIQTNFAEDLTLMSVMNIINCNYSIDESHEQKINQCISTLDKIVTNLAESNAEDREKFKKIRKAKIENRVLELYGGLEFIISIGFELDSQEEWFVFRGDEDRISDQMNYYKDVLNNAQQFPIILDRQQVLVESNQTPNDKNLSDDFFKLSADEVSHQMRNLTEKRELEETLRTRAMREQKQKRPNCKFSRLRFKLPSGSQMDATFKSNETLSDVKNWLLQNLDSINDFNLKCGPDLYNDAHLSKTINELNLVPTAALLVIPKEN